MNQIATFICRTRMYHGLGTAGMAGAEAARVTQRVFAEQLPALPLIVLPRVAAFGPGVCGLQADPSSVSLLWDLESLTPCAP